MRGEILSWASALKLAPRVLTIQDPGGAIPLINRGKREGGGNGSAVGNLLNGLLKGLRIVNTHTRTHTHCHARTIHVTCNKYMEWSTQDMIHCGDLRYNDCASDPAGGVFAPSHSYPLPPPFLGSGPCRQTGSVIARWNCKHLPSLGPVYKDTSCQFIILQRETEVGLWWERHR